MKKRGRLNDYVGFPCEPVFNFAADNDYKKFGECPEHIECVFLAQEEVSERRDCYAFRK